MEKVEARPCQAGEGCEFFSGSWEEVMAKDKHGVTRKFEFPCKSFEGSWQKMYTVWGKLVGCSNHKEKDWRSQVG